MPSFHLSDIRTLTSNYKSIARPSLYSVITDSSPEPTIASGVALGQTLLDKDELAVEPISEPDSTHRYSQRTRIRTPKASQHDQDTAAQKAKYQARRRKNSTTTIGSEGQTDVEHVSDSTQGPAGDGLNEILGGTAHAAAGNGGEGIPAVRQTSLQSDVLPRTSAPSVYNVHGHTVLGPHMGSVEGGGELLESERVSGAGGQDLGDGEQVAEGGGESNFWAFSVDHEQLERDIQRVCNSDLNAISQLPPEHLLSLIRELAAEHEQFIERQAHQGQTQQDPSQSGPSPPASSQPATSQPTNSQQAASRQAPSRQASSQEALSHRVSSQSTGPSQWQKVLKKYGRPTIQARQVQPPRSRKAEAQPIASRITVGGGHHLDQPRLNLKRPKSHHNNSRIDDSNTDTESETELEDQPPKRNIPPIRNPLANLPNHPLNSPSPLPSAHAPIDPSLHSILDFPANPHSKSLGSSQRSTQPLITSAQRAPQPLFRPTLSTTSSISLGQPYRSHQSSQPSANNTQLRPASGSYLLAQPQSSAVIPHPQGTAGQESSHAHRTARKRTGSQRMLPDHLHATIHRSTELARSRRTQCDASGSTNARPNRPAQPNLMEDDEEERAKRQAHARGEETRRGRKKKPSARDVYGNERQVLTHAKLHLYAYSIVEGPFQTRGVVQYWANPVWDLSWKEEFPELPIETPSYESVQIMINCQPTFRGQIKDYMCSLTQHLFGFIKPATTPEAIKHNIELCEQLTPNVFHHTSFDPLEGPYEGEAIYQAIAVALFRTPTSVGAAFPGYFNPCPLTAVAFSAANMQHTIKEYSTGQFLPRDLDATQMLGKFVAHLRGLKIAARTAKKRFAAHQLKWYQYGYDYLGAMQLDDPFTQPVITADDVRPDTPTGENDYLPETEGEENRPEVDENGQYTKRAKRKDRA